MIAGLGSLHNNEQEHPWQIQSKSKYSVADGINTAANQWESHRLKLITKDTEIQQEKKTSSDKRKMN